MYEFTQSLPDHVVKLVPGSNRVAQPSLQKKGRSIYRPLVTANRSQSEFEFESNLNLVHGWQCVEALGIDAVLEIVG